MKNRELHEWHNCKARWSLFGNARSFGGCDETLAVVVSDFGSFTERRRSFLLGMELGNRRIDRTGDDMSGQHDLGRYSASQNTCRQR
jgi:hypothetical protein